MAPQQRDIAGMEDNNNAPKRVLIVGAGPGGLLAAIHILRRNADGIKYHVTLVDPGVDYGLLDEKGLSRHRSWMIGLSAHGLGAVKEIPGLYEDYVEQLGVQIQKATVGLGQTTKFTQEWNEEGFCVDRNYVCAGLARYLNAHFGNDANYTAKYNTRALFVDAENHTVLVRPVNESSSEMIPLEYDILLGCDGIRSIVRNAFITNHRDFEFDIQGAFGTYKSVHLTLPESVGEGHFMFLLNCFPNVGAFVLPERGGKLNCGFGWNLNQPVDEALYSDDPAVVEAYARQHFKIFDMDYQEFAEQWTQQSFQSTQMVHCNFYHSDKIKALLLGDAAHATVPNIGQGMNTALADAAVLNRLLDTHKDDWEQVLPAFSEERVKEGNALTELSYHTFSIDPLMMMSIALRQQIHRTLNRILPTWLLEPEPMQQVARGAKLSVAYDKMVQYGYMAKSRQRNMDIKRDYFEKKVGMVQERKGTSTYAKVGVAAAVAALGYGIAVRNGSK